MGWALTSQTTQSSVCSLASYKDGALGITTSLFLTKVHITHFSHYSFRCTARSTRLDQDEPRQRTKNHTNVLLEELELGTLWTEYGLVGDVIVSFPMIVSPIFPTLLHVCNEYFILTRAGLGNQSVFHARAATITSDHFPWVLALVLFWPSSRTLTRSTALC